MRLYCSWLCQSPSFAIDNKEQWSRRRFHYIWRVQVKDGFIEAAHHIESPQLVEATLLYFQQDSKSGLAIHDVKQSQNNFDW